jgi:hypothetical protein
VELFYLRSLHVDKSMNYITGLKFLAYLNTSKSLLSKHLKANKCLSFTYTYRLYFVNISVLICALFNDAFSSLDYIA